MAGSVTGPGALFFRLQWENTLFRVRVKWGSRRGLPVTVVFSIVRTPMRSDTKSTLIFLWLVGMFFVGNLRASLISVKRRDWELCRFLQIFIPTSLIRV